MGQNPSETGPIAGEPALMKHIGYALDLVDMVIRNSHHEVDIQDLIKIQHHLINAKHTVPANIRTEKIDDSKISKLYVVVQDIAGDDWYDCDAQTEALELIESLMGAGEITEKIDEDDGSCEGEMRAEAEAERQADAALELSAELASCDWESWE